MRTLLISLLTGAAMPAFAQNSLEESNGGPLLWLECVDDTCIDQAISCDRRVVGHNITSDVGHISDGDFRFGYVNAKDELVIPMRYQEAGTFKGGLALVRDPDLDCTHCCPSRYYHIKLDGTPLYSERYCTANSFVNGYARIEATGHYDMFHIDMTGKRLYPQKYTWLFDFTTEGLSLVQKPRKGTKYLSFNWYVINTKGEELVTLEYHEGDPGEARDEFLERKKKGEFIKFYAVGN